MWFKYNRRKFSGSGSRHSYLFDLQDMHQELVMDNWDIQLWQLVLWLNWSCVDTFSKLLHLHLHKYCKGFQLAGMTSYPVQVKVHIFTVCPGLETTICVCIAFQMAHLQCAQGSRQLYVCVLPSRWHIYSVPRARDNYMCAYWLPDGTFTVCPGLETTICVCIAFQMVHLQCAQGSRQLYVCVLPSRWHIYSVPRARDNYMCVYCLPDGTFKTVSCLCNDNRFWE